MILYHLSRCTQPQFIEITSDSESLTVKIPKYGIVLDSKCISFFNYKFIPHPPSSQVSIIYHLKSLKQHKYQHSHLQINTKEVLFTILNLEFMYVQFYTPHLPE